MHLQYKIDRYAYNDDCPQRVRVPKEFWPISRRPCASDCTCKDLENECLQRTGINAPFAGCDIMMFLTLLTLSQLINPAAIRLCKTVLPCANCTMPPSINFPPAEQPLRKKDRVASIFVIHHLKLVTDRD